MTQLDEAEMNRFQYPYKQYETDIFAVINYYSSSQKLCLKGKKIAVCSRADPQSSWLSSSLNARIDATMQVQVKLCSIIEQDKLLWMTVHL